MITVIVNVQKEYLLWVIVGNLFAYFFFYFSHHCIFFCFVATSSAIGADVNTVSTILSKLCVAFANSLKWNTHTYTNYTQMSEMNKILNGVGLKKRQRIICGIFVQQGQWTGTFYCVKREKRMNQAVNENANRGEKRAEEKNNNNKNRSNKGQPVHIMCITLCAKSV